MKLTEEKLRQLMVDLEAENVERTRAFDKAYKMGQAICAFANDLADRRIPGYLLLGVENDGTSLDSCRRTKSPELRGGNKP